MARRMLVDAVHPEETRVVITDKKSTILEYDFTTAAKPQIKGNVYLAKVTRVEPSLQAAFVEYGGGKQGFLPFSEIHPNYYQIPVSDREKLLAEEEEEAAHDIEDDDEVESEAEIDDDDGEEEDSETIAEDNKQDESVASDEVEEDESDKESGDETTPEGEQAEDESRPRRRRRGGRGRNRDRNRGRNNRSRRGNSEDGEGVETVSGDEEFKRPRRKRDYLRRYKIQEVIKRNQVLLVQVIKEERGSKGVSLTSFLSLAGRYCVLMPNSGQGGGVSRKISSRDDRKKLKKTLSDLSLPKGMSVIIRTAGAGHTRSEIKRDFDYLVKVWNQIREDTLGSEAPALIYEESNVVQRTIRDSYNTDISEIMVDGEKTFKETKAFMRKLIPSHAPRVKLFKEEVPLFHKERIEEQLLSMHEPEVRLPSGGSIVMMPTEALISIDVNSGRSTRERNVEETAVNTNIEAAKEVARQLRLRDLAGLIVIDFIDMMEGKNRRAVERAMKEALRTDRAKIQVGRISSFGLMEMSRQRMRPSIAETINRMCPHCQGTGHIRSEASLGIQIIRSLEKEASAGHYDRFRVSVTAEEAMYILNNMRSELDHIEEQYECEIEITIDTSLYEGNFRLEKFRRKKTDRRNNTDNSQGKSSSRGNRHTSKKDDTSEPEESSDETEEEEVIQDNADEEVPEEKPQRKTRGRKKASDDDNQGEPKEDKKKTTRTRRTTRKPKNDEVEENTDKKVEKLDDAKPAPKKKKEKKDKRTGWWQRIVE